MFRRHIVRRACRDRWTISRRGLWRNWNKAGTTKGGKMRSGMFLFLVLIEGKECCSSGDSKVAGSFFVAGRVSEDIAKSDWLP